jgi:hypothetical protein
MQLSTGPPDTVLPAEPGEVLAALDGVRRAGPAERRDAAAAVAARWPRSLLAWAGLGDHGRDDIEAYTAYRVGYHRGLDALRQNGWRGSGYVRWRHETNRGFLRCLAGLQRQASVIGEEDEAERCRLFLHQCDPSWPPAELA